MKFKLLYLILIIGLFLLISPRLALASTLYLSPGSANIPVGEITSVQIRLNTGGESVNGVSAVLSYPQDKLNVAWVGGGSAFTIDAEKSYGGGVIRISKGNISPVSGNIAVATIGFSGKSEGSASVSFIGGSAVPRAADSSDSLNLGGSAGGSYKIGKALPKAKATPANPAVSGTAVAALQISDLKVTNIATNSALVAWKTDSLSDSLVEFGLEKDKYFLDVSDSQLTLDHQITLSHLIIQPGLKIFLQVKSKDVSNNVVTSKGLELQFLGYQAVVKVVDNEGKPVKNIEVWLYSLPMKVRTNDLGEAFFQNITAGKHLVVIKQPLGETTADIEVNNHSQPQTFTLKANPKVDKTLASQFSSNSLKLIIGIVAVILILGIAVYLVVRKRRQKKQDQNLPSPIPVAVQYPIQSNENK